MAGREAKQQFNFKILLKELELAHHVFLTQTGFASVALAIMSVCRPGDEIVISDCVYRPTRKLVNQLLAEFNIKGIWYDPNSLRISKIKLQKNKTYLCRKSRK